MTRPELHSGTRPARREDLVRAVTEGREVAALKNVIRRMVGSSPEVADLVQEVFLAALEDLDHFRGTPLTVSRWLRGIATNKSLEHLRWRRLRRNVELDDLVDQALTNSVCMTESRCDLALLGKSLHAFPEEEQVCLRLRYLEGRSLHEVASATNVSLATVKRRLGRALLRARVWSGHRAAQANASGPLGSARGDTPDDQEEDLDD